MHYDILSKSHRVINDLIRKKNAFIMFFKEGKTIPMYDSERKKCNSLANNLEKREKLHFGSSKQDCLRAVIRFQNTNVTNLIRF